MTNAALPAKQPPESWVNDYGDSLLRVCYARLRDRQLAQDALQETLLKAWEAWKRGGRVASERAWLYKIALNTCRDIQKSAWSRHVDKRVCPEDLPLSDGATPEDGLLFMEVMRLPDKLRQAVVLYYYHNLTQEEIAAAAGVSVVMIHRRLKKARALLKIEIEEGERHA